MRQKKYPKAGRPPKITEQAIEFARLALCQRHHKYAIFALLKKTYGVSSRTCERILSHARGRIRDGTGKEIDQHRSDAYAFYDSIIRQPNASIREKILAQERIDALLGLERPTKIEHTGADGKPLEVDVAVEPIVDYDAFARAFTQALSGSSRSPGGASPGANEGHDRP
jgi:hypothetical protein